MRIMGREDMFMFISEVDIQNKSRAGDICQIAGGKWKLSLWFWNKFHSDKSTDFSTIL